MLKKALALFMVIVLCLSVCACKNDSTDQPNQSTSDTTENTQPTGNTQDTEPTVTTAPPEATKATEPPVVESSVADWQLEEKNYLSYEEYFSTQRDFTVTVWADNPRRWVKGGHIYDLVWKIPVQDALEIKCYETGRAYTIPNSGAYEKYSIAGADGRYGYLYNANQFLRMNLATGEVEVLLDGKQFHSIRLRDNLVLYYLSSADGKLILSRFYLPTGKQETIAEMPGEFYQVAIEEINSTTGPLVWTMINPDMIDLLKAELANPNSQYQKRPVTGVEGPVVYDYTKFWEAEDGIVQILREPGLLHHIQDTSGVRAFMQCTYNLSDGSLTKKTGVIDNCFHGSGMPHDHFNPEITTAEPVELIMGQWKDLLDKLPSIITTDEINTESLILPDVDSNRYLYGHDNKKLIDSPVNWAVDTGNGAIYISADKRSVFAVSYTDGQPIEIYRSAENDITIPGYDVGLDLERQWLVVLEGDTLVQIDLAAGKSRELVRHQYIQPYYYIDYDQPTVYFEICAGLYGTGYTIDMETGELREHYRL